MRKNSEKIVKYQWIYRAACAVRSAGCLRMIRINLTNEILKYITEIGEIRSLFYISIIIDGASKQPVRQEWDSAFFLSVLAGSGAEQNAGGCPPPV